jgi:hypothetical protein
MIISSVQITDYTVVEFMDRNGHATDIDNATIIICVSKVGLAMPFTKDRLGSQVKIGDVFQESITIIDGSIIASESKSSKLS